MVTSFMKTSKTKSPYEQSPSLKKSIYYLWVRIHNNIDQWFFAYLALSFFLGVAIVGAVGFKAGLLLPALLAAALVFLVTIVIRRFHLLLFVGLLLGGFWCGCQLMNLENLPAPPGRTLALEGKVVEINESKRDYLSNVTNDGKEREEGRTTFIFQSTQKNGWRGRIMAFAEEYELKVGDRIQMKAIVQESKTYSNWLAGSNEHYLRNQGIAGIASVTPDGITFLDIERQNPLQTFAGATKAKLYTVLDSLPQMQREFIKGIAFGEKKGLSGYQKQVLAQTGIIHIFAVSGLHIGFVVMFAAFLAELFSKLLPLRARGKFVIILIVTLFYGMITGFTPSVFRATVMSLTAAFALLFGENNTSKATIVYAAFLCVVWQPLLIFDIGFQLSFLATAGIIFTKDVLKGLTKWQPLQITLAAQFAVVPLTAYYFSVITLLGLLLSPIATFGAGLVVILVLLALPLLPVGLADVPLYGAGLVAEFMYNGAEKLSGLPFVSFTIARPSILFVVGYFVLLLAGYFFLQQSNQAMAVEGATEK